MSDDATQEEPNKAETPTEKPLNIYQRLHNVMRDCGYLQKEFKKEIKHFAISHDDVTHAVRDACLKNGVFLHISTVMNPSTGLPDIETSEVIRHTFKGERVCSYTKVSVALTWVNIDDPEDTVFGVFAGHGEGTDCKTPGAAYSFAVKTAMLKSLSIVTGEDEEVKASPDTDNCPTRETSVKAKVIASADDRDEFYAGLKEHCEKNGFTYSDALVWIKDAASIELDRMNPPQLQNALKHVVNNYKGEKVVEGGENNG